MFKYNRIIFTDAVLLALSIIGFLMIPQFYVSFNLEPTMLFLYFEKCAINVIGFQNIEQSNIGEAIVLLSVITVHFNRPIRNTSHEYGEAI